MNGIVKVGQKDRMNDNLSTLSQCSRQYVTVISYIKLAEDHTQVTALLLIAFDWITICHIHVDIFG